MSRPSRSLPPFSPPLIEFSQRPLAVEDPPVGDPAISEVLILFMAALAEVCPLVCDPVVSATEDPPTDMDLHFFPSPLRSDPTGVAPFLVPGWLPVSPLPPVGSFPLYIPVAPLL
ncbi:hypothetical protein AMTR_s00070p00187260 [Amborella trichopoda]|uniref:Uncharacterized protein n=1 Tax=Amborella trichopoda TaxID=13333 RepID=U5DGQ9_AMBTC|nr:hypothetical protein AMTR_s00070p00187260 [Amborella trichopoda]